MKKVRKEEIIWELFLLIIYVSIYVKYGANYYEYLIIGINENYGLGIFYFIDIN